MLHQHRGKVAIFFGRYAKRLSLLPPIRSQVHRGFHATHRIVDLGKADYPVLQSVGGTGVVNVYNSILIDTSA